MWFWKNVVDLQVMYGRRMVSIFAIRTTKPGCIQLSGREIAGFV